MFWCAVQDQTSHAVHTLDKGMPPPLPPTKKTEIESLLCNRESAKIFIQGGGGAACPTPTASGLAPHAPVLLAQLPDP